MRFSNTGVDFWLILVALIALCICLLNPRMPMEQDTYRYIFVLDITQSMNTRDYHLPNLPPDRLSFSKQAMRSAIQKMPCGSKTGIALFTTQNVMLLFDPLEVCAHFSVIDNVISRIDWRMSWAADSNIERGLYTAIRTAINQDKPTHLVFLSDGEQNVSELHRPPLTKHFGAAKGFIIGVGGTDPTPIPKLDAQNNLIGYWSNNEVEIFPLSGAALTKNLEKNTASPAQDNYLSVLHEDDLRFLARSTGLSYQKLENPDQFTRLLQTPSLAEQRTIKRDIRWMIALFALALIVGTNFRHSQLLDTVRLPQNKSI